MTPNMTPPNMNEEICGYESAVITALTTGDTPAEIQRHLKSCPMCRESELVWRYLETLAIEERCDAPLPSADLIWWRAQLAEKRKLAARSIAAIEIVQKAAMLLIAGFLVVAASLWGRDVFGGWTLTFPVALAALLLVAGSLGGMFYAWIQGHSARFLARQR